MSAPGRRYLIQHRLRLLLGVLAITGLGGGAPSASAAPAVFSLTPANIRAAYSLPKTGARHQTIAVVSALDDPSVAADLDAYTKRFGIPPCTAANHCFTELNEDGAASPLPATDQSGVLLTESSVGVEVARGICQSCSIMLIEARSPSKFDVSTAVGTAARLGATVVETAFEDAPAPDDDTQFAGDYSHPGTVVVAASGDAAYTGRVFFPASMPSVLAVGGTELELTSSGQYKDELAWQATTSGCSPYDDAGVWQTSLAASVGCGAKRAVADLAAVAEPGMLVHVQDAGTPCGNVFCEADGTSVSAPIIAGMIGLAGSLGSDESKLIYAHARSEHNVFRDITAGAVAGCHGEPICQARRGYDGPTGLGTPYGLGAFLRSGGALDPRHRHVTVVAPGGRLRIGSNWKARLRLNNGNPFAISGSLVLGRALRAHGALRTLARTSVTRGPLAGAPVVLTVPARYRALLKGLGELTAYVRLRIRGSAGRELTITERVRLTAP